MNCRDCQAKISDLSADALASPDAILMREHLEDCPACKKEMAVLERTLFSVSSATQHLPSPLASEQMWHRCSEHIFQKVEAERNGAQQPAAAQREYSLQSGAGWFSRQPRWSWATLGGALAILGGVWFLAPQEDAALIADQNFSAQNNAPAKAVALHRPSGPSSVLVNHHLAMAVDPFTDHVGATLVSYSASSPQTSARR